MKPDQNNNFKLNIFTIIGLNLMVNIINLGSIQFLTKAQTNLNNSLEQPISDPLIPPASINRDLSPSETRRIQQEIVKINQQATKELALGNQELAFQIWFRELRLQRALGQEAEIVALGRVGNIAWQQNRGIELREIAQRLISIETTATKNDNLSEGLLNNLGLAYQQIKYLDRAINIYQIILKEARQKNNIFAQQKNLEQLGQLYLAKFDYAPAASIYEELLALIRDNLRLQNNPQIIEGYLLNLVEVYSRLQQPEAAIKIQKQLIEQYVKAGKIAAVAKLKINLGNNYRELQQVKLASQYYQEAYTLAQSTQQVALAADALTQLAILYQQENQAELAIAIYQQLIAIEQKNNNFYGLINAYENLGDIYLEIEEYEQALASFESGLAIATTFDYPVDNLLDKIQQLK